MATEDLVQAVREQLAAFLLAQLGPAYPAIGGVPQFAVYQDWPDKNDTTKHVVTVLGAADGEYTFNPPEVIKVTTDVSPAKTGTVLYTYGRCDNLPLQIDMWAASKFERDALARRLRLALNQPPAVTLGLSTAPPLQCEGALVLAVTGLFGQPCEYEFTPVTAPQENADNAGTGRLRASWRGAACFSLVDQQAGVLLKKRLRFLIGAGELALHTNVREERAADGSTTLRIVPSPIVLGRPGAQQLRIVATFAGGFTADVTKLCTFVSDAKTTANADATGLVLAGLNAGTAHITVAYGGITASVTVTVS